LSSLPLHAAAAARDRPSFPTRRSSDLVGADTAGDHQHVAAGGIECAFALDREGVDHGVLEAARDVGTGLAGAVAVLPGQQHLGLDRKSTRLNSSHVKTSYAVFCLKKKT